MSFTILQKLSLTCLKADQPLLSKFIQRKHCHNKKIHEANFLLQPPYVMLVRKPVVVLVTKKVIPDQNIVDGVYKMVIMYRRVHCWQHN